MLDQIVSNPIVRNLVNAQVKSTLKKSEAHGLYLYLDECEELNIKAFEQDPQTTIEELRAENERLQKLVNYLTQ